jgi:hypothetical protein
MKKLTTFKGIKKGQKFKVINKRGSHNYPVNKVLTFKHDGPDNFTMSDCAVEKSGGNTLQADQIVLLAQDLKSMKEQVTTLKLEFNNEISELESKIKFCEEQGLEEFDEDTFKVYSTLSILKTKKSDIEKAKIIASLIKGDS